MWINCNIITVSKNIVLHLFKSSPQYHQLFFQSVQIPKNRNTSHHLATEPEHFRKETHLQSAGTEHFRKLFDPSIQGFTQSLAKIYMRNIYKLQVYYESSNNSESRNTINGKLYTTNTSIMKKSRASKLNFPTISFH